MTRRPAARQFWPVALIAVALLLSGCIPPSVRWVSPRSGSTGSASHPPGQAQWHACPELAKELLERTPTNFDFACSTIAGAP